MICCVSLCMQLEEERLAGQRCRRGHGVHSSVIREHIPENPWENPLNFGINIHSDTETCDNILVVEFQDHGDLRNVVL